MSRDTTYNSVHEIPTNDNHLEDEGSNRPEKKRSLSRVFINGSDGGGMLLVEGGLRDDGKLYSFTAFNFFSLRGENNTGVIF